MKNYRKKLSEKERESLIFRGADAYGKWMDIVLPGWENDPNSRDTPHRVAKMFVNELYAGLYGDEPKITAFENVDKYTGLVFEGNVEVKSQCSHHHMPFKGVAHVAYIPSETGKIIGLSKINRAVEFFARRPQVQENLTTQIHDFLNEIVGENLGVVVCIEAEHLCVSHRGARQSSVMKTTKLSGIFEESAQAREEFYNYIRDLKR